MKTVNKTLKTFLSEPIKNGYSPVCVNKQTGQWVLGLGALQENGFDQTQIKAVPIDNKKIQQFFLKTGDFLVSRSNTLDKVGRAILFKGEIENCAYPDLMMKFRVDETKINPDFLELFLKSKNAKKYFQRCAAGTSGSMVKITKHTLENIKVPHIPFAQQQQIAEILQTWDKAIQLTEQLIEKKQHFKKAMMQKLLNGNIRFPGFCEPWKVVKFDKLLHEVNKEKVKNPSEHQLLTVKLHFKGAEKTGKYPRTTRNGRPYFIRNHGELVIGRQNIHNGGVAIVTKEGDGCIASNAISSFQSNNGNLEFILNIMTTKVFLHKVDTLSGGTGQKEISNRQFLNLRLNVPMLEEQEKIASFLLGVDNEIKFINFLQQKLKTQKNQLMQKLLTGKLITKSKG